MVETAGRTVVEPPALTAHLGTAAVTTFVIVELCSAELHDVGAVSLVKRHHQSISGVSAVPTHLQLIFVQLVADRERLVNRLVHLRVAVTLNLTQEHVT